MKDIIGPAGGLFISASGERVSRTGAQALDQGQGHGHGQDSDPLSVVSLGVHAEGRGRVQAIPTGQRISSRISGFAQMSARGRLSSLTDRDILAPEDIPVLLATGGLPLEFAESFIENCVGGFTLPMGIATNFLIDGEDLFIPMVVEESSVVAAASHGAKLARSGGGFRCQPTRTVATCQVQFFASHSEELKSKFEALKPTLFDIAQACHPRLRERGGGVTGVEIRELAKPGYFVIHIHVDTREAMGANIVNTIAEEVGRRLPSLLPCSVGLKILTNLTLNRVTKVSCEVELSALAMSGFSGEESAERICAAWEFADLDPFRAATHNKGVMNGIDPVVIATGNDWRAVEAGCHAYASLSGSYKPLTHWFINAAGRLQGDIEVPVAVGTVGGVTRLHPTVLSVFKLLGFPTADKLSGIIAAVGLAQNLSALRALACEGIQRGHMALHEKNIEMMRRYDNLPHLAAVCSVSQPGNQMTVHTPGQTVAQAPVQTQAQTSAQVLDVER